MTAPSKIMAVATVMYWPIVASIVVGVEVGLAVGLGVAVGVGGIVGVGFVVGFGEVFEVWLGAQVVIGIGIYGFDWVVNKISIWWVLK